MRGAALKAESVLFLSNVPGLLRDVADPSSLIAKLSLADLADALANVAQGRMKKKVMAAAEAIEAGVGRCVFGDARIEQPVRATLKGRGTVIVR